ncbi:MAG: prenyltransferase/squalene oxidase repeat-containing protein [bacterium]
MSSESFASPPPDGTALDSYLVRERPALDFAAEQARRVPWWAISFLVHALALLVMWRWPIDARAVEPAWDKPVLVPVWRDRDEEVERPEIVEPPRPPEVEPDILPPDPKLGHPDAEIETDLVEKPPLIPFEDLDADPLVDLLPQKIFVLEDPALDPRRKRALLDGRDDLYDLTSRVPRGDPDGGSDLPGVTEIFLGLRWLKQAQSPDGSWDAQQWGGGKPYHVGMTGLALLAFHGAGYTAERERFGDTVRRGLRWLASHQRPNGSFPWTTFYEQGIATMAVAEAYAMTRNPRVGRMAQKAVDYVVQVQPDHGGYRYGGAVPRGEGDMSVTGWQIMALKSAQCAEDLRVPAEAIERSRTFLRNAKRKYGTSAYIVSSPSPGSLAVTSVGMTCRIFTEADAEFHDAINAAATTLLERETDGGVPVTGGSSRQLTRNLYYVYYSALAMYQAGSEHWRLWRQSYYEPLRQAMVRDEQDARGRYVRGSWDPAGYQWGKRGGRVYATAMAVLSLEVPFRYLRIYRANR